MKANVYIADDETENPEIVQLQGIFQEDSKFDIAKTEIKFASMREIEDLKTLIVKRVKEQKNKLKSWLKDDKEIQCDIYFDFTQELISQHHIDKFKVYEGNNHTDT